MPNPWEMEWQTAPPTDQRKPWEMEWQGSSGAVPTTAGTGRTGTRLKGTPSGGSPILPMATAAMIGAPILGEGAALLPLEQIATGSKGAIKGGIHAIPSARTTGPATAGALIGELIGGPKGAAIGGGIGAAPSVIGGAIRGARAALTPIPKIDVPTYGGPPLGASPMLRDDVSVGGSMPLTPPEGSFYNWAHPRQEELNLGTPPTRNELDYMAMRAGQRQPPSKPSTISKTINIPSIEQIGKGFNPTGGSNLAPPTQQEFSFTPGRTVNPSPTGNPIRVGKWRALQMARETGQPLSEIEEHLQNQGVFVDWNSLQ